MSAIPPGYKQTEVGVIPEEWEATTLGSLGVFSKGRGICKAEASSGEIPCVRYGELYTHHNDIIRDFHSYISRAVARSSKRLTTGDLLFAGSGETKEDIGKCAAFLGEDEAYAGGDIVIMSPLNVDSRFLGYLANAPVIARQKASKGQGDAIVHISSTALSSVSFPLPPTITEQLAIAGALSDADALIAALDKLIAKKRDIKQAAMQQLLTGKKRLPGFSGEWEVKRLGDVLKVRHGRSQHGVATADGIYEILGSGGVIGHTNAYLYDKPSVLIGRKGTIDTPQYVDKPFWTIDTLFYTEIVTEASAKFVFYYFCTICWRSFNEASGVPSLNSSTIEKIGFSCPRFPEQIAIAKVLSDMDAEIEALEQRLDKTKALKQGMMQALLTGRIRLI